MQHSSDLPTSQSWGFVFAVPSAARGFSAQLRVSLHPGQRSGDLFMSQLLRKGRWDGCLSFPRVLFPLEIHTCRSQLCAGRSVGSHRSILCC